MKTKDLEYWKNNCEEDYLHTPISVLKYIRELEGAIDYAHSSSQFKEKYEKGFEEFVIKDCKKILHPIKYKYKGDYWSLELLYLIWLKEGI